MENLEAMTEEELLKAETDAFAALGKALLEARAASNHLQDIQRARWLRQMKKRKRK